MAKSVYHWQKKKEFASEELKKLKEEIKQMPNESWNDCDTIDRKELLYRIDKRIEELKGKQE